MARLDKTTQGKVGLKHAAGPGTAGQDETRRGRAGQDNARKRGFEAHGRVWHGGAGQDRTRRREEFDKVKVGARICIEGVITHMDAEHVLVRLETGGELAIPRGWFHSPIYKASFACPTLTDLQKETLDIICGYRRIHGMAPTVRELCRIMSIRSTCTMQRRIQVLRRKGYLAASNNRSRSLRPVEFLGDESEQPLGVTRQ